MWLNILKNHTSSLSPKPTFSNHCTPSAQPPPKSLHNQFSLKSCLHSVSPSPHLPCPHLPCLGQSAHPLEPTGAASRLLNPVKALPVGLTRKAQTLSSGPTWPPLLRLTSDFLPPPLWTLLFLASCWCWRSWRLTPRPPFLPASPQEEWLPGPQAADAQPHLCIPALQLPPQGASAGVPQAPPAQHMPREPPPCSCPVHCQRVTQT